MDKQRKLGYEIIALSNHLKRIVPNESTFGDEELTGMQMWIIGHITNGDSSEPVFQKQLEETFSITRSTASTILRLMEKRGLIRRLPVDYDARLKRIELTEKSREIAKQISADLQNLESRMTRGISQQELDTFFRVLDMAEENLSR